MAYIYNIKFKSNKNFTIVFSFYLYVITSFITLVLFVDLNTIQYEKFDYIFWLNIFSITIFASTFANTIYFLGIEKLGTSAVSSFIFLVPFFAIVLSIIFLNEKVTISIILGTILTLISVKILNNIKIFRKKVE